MTPSLSSRILATVADWYVLTPEALTARGPKRLAGGGMLTEARHVAALCLKALGATVSEIGRVLCTRWAKDVLKAARRSRIAVGVSEQLIPHLEHLTPTRTPAINVPMSAVQRAARRWRASLTLPWTDAEAALVDALDREEQR